MVFFDVTVDYFEYIGNLNIVDIKEFSFEP